MDCLFVQIAPSWYHDHMSLLGTRKTLIGEVHKVSLFFSVGSNKGSTVWCSSVKHEKKKRVCKYDHEWQICSAFHTFCLVGRLFLDQILFLNFNVVCTFLQRFECFVIWYVGFCAENSHCVCQGFRPGSQGAYAVIMCGSHYGDPKPFPYSYQIYAILENVDRTRTT